MNWQIGPNANSDINPVHIESGKVSGIRLDITYDATY